MPNRKDYAVFSFDSASNEYQQESIWLTIEGAKAHKERWCTYCELPLIILKRIEEEN